MAFLIAVKADELVFAVDVDLVAVFLDQLLVAVGKPVVEDIGHGHELDRPLGGRKRVAGGAGASAAAADQGHADRVVFSGMDRRNSHARQG